MELKEIESRVKKIISEQLGVSTGDIKDDTKMVDDLGADSLDNVELVMAMEDEFEMEISNEAAEKIHTYREIVDFLVAAKTAA